jgi:hypothetical protein
MLAPVLKLFFNPNPLIHVLHMQSQINDLNAGRHQLYYELIHNLVVETTRLGIEVKNLRMRVESLDARVDFSERRARALEGAVMYRPQIEEEREVLRPSPIAPPERMARAPGSAGPATEIRSAPAVATASPGPGQGAESSGQRSKRRRRRRGRRGGLPAAAIMGSPAGSTQATTSPGPSAPPGASEPATETVAAPPSSDSEIETGASGHGSSTPSAASGPGGFDDEQ